MKYLRVAIILLAVVSLVACSISITTPTQLVSENNSTDLPMTQYTPSAIPAQTTDNRNTEEAEVRALVEAFGKRLQMVSLQAPDAAQEMQTQYAEFVTPSLLESWKSDVLNAPGRIVSSPWPDYIEITTLSKRAADSYDVTGFVIEMTSKELTEGAAAEQLPVKIVVRKDRARWLIAGYAEER